MVIELMKTTRKDPPVTTTPDGAVSDEQWQAEMQNFIVGRYGRVQAAAQTWLTIMTTLFGLFSTVVVVSGAKTISEIGGGQPWRIGVVAGAAAVFLLAFAATMYGLRASWGGLGGLMTEQDDPKEPSGWSELCSMWRPKDLTVSEVEGADWQKFREYTLARANRNHQRLRRSRVLGVMAVASAGLLGFALIFNGFIT
jgi:hypothetical protein